MSKTDKTMFLVFIVSIMLTSLVMVSSFRNMTDPNQVDMIYSRQVDYEGYGDYYFYFEDNNNTLVSCATSSNYLVQILGTEEVRFMVRMIDDKEAYVIVDVTSIDGEGQSEVTRYHIYKVGTAVVVMDNDALTFFWSLLTNILLVAIWGMYRFLVLRWSSD
jgi:hypothetical protein